MRLKIDAIKSSKTYMISSIQQRRQSCSLARVYLAQFSDASCCSAQMSSQWCNKLSSYKIKRSDTCLNRSQCAEVKKYNHFHTTFLSQWSALWMPFIKIGNERLAESERRTTLVFYGLITFSCCSDASWLPTQRQCGLMRFHYINTEMRKDNSTGFRAAVYKTMWLSGCRTVRFVADHKEQCEVMIHIYCNSSYS